MFHFSQIYDTKYHSPQSAHDHWNHTRHTVTDFALRNLPDYQEIPNPRHLPRKKYGRNLDWVSSQVTIYQWKRKSCSFRQNNKIHNDKKKKVNKGHNRDMTVQQRLWVSTQHCQVKSLHATEQTCSHTHTFILIMTCTHYSAVQSIREETHTGMHSLNIKASENQYETGSPAPFIVHQTHSVLWPLSITLTITASLSSCITLRETISYQPTSQQLWWGGEGSQDQQNLEAKYFLDGDVILLSNVLYY